MRAVTALGWREVWSESQVCRHATVPAEGALKKDSPQDPAVETLCSQAARTCEICMTWYMVKPFELQ
ncbi:hypothetical protein M011DRAFT_470922 [Sporormia fimetaria CBS 119925]|uniref:Uncharacterized protein n=1 Tax=Sporormia fimetaria CBS 119925 TaxID=1340428 RepID=A0A6A6V0F8_9PLEO|nr:hypothetical protein M011DRAFT_470922 [Sporormia fimetaria CBS 119925]